MATTHVVKSASTTLVGRSARSDHCRRGHVPEAPRRSPTDDRNAWASRDGGRHEWGTFGQCGCRSTTSATAHRISAPATRPRDYVEVLVHVRLAPNTLPEVFDGFLRTEPAVLQAWRLAGDIDFEVHLRCQGLSDLHALLGRARKLGGAQETTTHLVLSSADDR